MYGANDYRTCLGQLTDITSQVTDKYRCNGKTKVQHMSNWQNVLRKFEERFSTRANETGKPCFIIPQKMYVISLVPWTTRYLSVSMHSVSVIACWTCGQCPEHLQLTCCMSGNSLAGNKVHRTSTDANWKSTRQRTHKFRTKRMPAHSYHTSSGRLFPVESVPSFVHA